MADSNHPNAESVDIELKPDVAVKPPAANLRPRETVRIQLPPRPPSDKSPIPPPIGSPPSVPVPAPQPPPVPAPSIPVSNPVSLEPKNETEDIAVMPELKKETARIPLIPEPPSKPLPTVQMKKTQPLVPMPEAAAQSASISVAPVDEGATIPMPVCWTLLGVSAIILIIQIWMYFS
jgi:hypothetical protein